MTDLEAPLCVGTCVSWQHCTPSSQPMLTDASTLSTNTTQNPAAAAGVGLLAFIYVTSCCLTPHRTSHQARPARLLDRAHTCHRHKPHQ
jgi:hypothetical protein